jgi:hypothetical protein
MNILCGENELAEQLSPPLKATKKAALTLPLQILQL